MLLIILLLSVAVLASPITVPLKIANETGYFFPNGTLDAENIRHHIRYIQCHCQQSRTAKSLCRFDAPLRKRAVESIGLSSEHAEATPVGELRVGGQAINVFFDTIVPVTIVDPRAYNPQDSPTAQRIGQTRLSDVPIMGESQVSRWLDVTSVGNIETMMTFDRAEQDMFNPAQTDARGICAMSRGGLSLIEVLRRNSLLDRPVFAFSLIPFGPNAANAANHRGTLFLGSHRRGLRFVAVEQHPTYARLLAINGLFNGIPSRMILASGSPLIILPIDWARSVFNTLNMVVEDRGTTVFAKYTCTETPIFRILSRFASITLSRDSVRFGRDPAGLCISSIVGEEQNDIILGLPFFRSAYVAFDLERQLSQSGPPGRVGIGGPGN
ncbi:hypothetical protein V8E36_006231 [Tilletia maclaganii]